MKKRLFILAILPIAAALSADICSCGEGLSADEALRLAREKAGRLGYDMAVMGSMTSKNRMPLGGLHQLGTEGKNALAGRKYWAVYFYPANKDILGGDILIFIDANTGEILYLTRGK